MVNLAYEKDPSNYAEERRRPKRAEWEVAMREEARALQDNGVWCVAKSGVGSNPLQSKLV